MCVRVHGISRVRLVMDPFMGLGNTAMACVNLGVSCAGFEIDREYYDYCCDRIGETVTGPDSEKSDKKMLTLRGR